MKHCQPEALECNKLKQLKIPRVPNETHENLQTEHSDTFYEDRCKEEVMKFRKVVELVKDCQN